MNNVTNQFNAPYVPVKALLIYQSAHEEKDNYGAKANDIYVESYDIGKHGNPINAHPLSVKEMTGLSELLRSTEALQDNYLQCKGIFPNKLIYVKPSKTGYAMWYTPQQEVNLFFNTGLGISSGKANIPAMLWKATRERLQVFALKGKAKPNQNTPLYFAPFFNLSQDGAVCMGTVNINIDRNCFLENFMSQWESYFFNSYFTHTLGNFRHCNGNLVELWQQQVSTKKTFPQDELIKNGRTVNDLIR